MSNLEIVFVLISPARGGNVGAVARALTTMGFVHLRIVDTQMYDRVEARSWAHGSVDLLENARDFASLEMAINDCDLVIGTSGRRRGDRRDYLTPEALRDHLDATAVDNGRVAILFGPEDHGLTNKDLDTCQLVSEIPMRRSYPSLNLAQAVMVYAYALSPLSFVAAEAQKRETPPESVRALHRRVRALLPQLGFSSGRAVTERILERVGLAQGIDLNLLHSVTNAIERRLGEIEGRYRSPE